jgi:uncharacterized protein (DUF1499 family)
MNIDQIEAPDSFTNPLERFGDFMATPGRLFFGRSYCLQKTSTGDQILAEHEKFFSITSVVKKIFVLYLLPISILSTAIGIGLKYVAHVIDPNLKAKYAFKRLINARTEENFLGKLPQNPLTPNCVNSQRKSLWGALYNAEPIQIPTGINNPLSHFQNVIRKQFPKAELLEKKGNYLHYIFTVEIPSGPLKGIYIDDLDAYYDEENRYFDIRSASRVGIRDALHLDFNLPGANKKRIEAIRSFFIL